MLTSVRSTYPDGVALAAFLESHGITLSAAQDALTEGAASAAAYEFEKATYRRMLPGTAATRYFSPPVDGHTLPIPELSANPSAVTYTPPGGSAETLVLNTDYWLLPDNALDQGKPIDEVEFLQVWGSRDNSLRRAIAITGLWGYAATLPEDVWQAVCMRAAYGLWSQVTLATTGGVLGWKDGDRSVDYGVERWNSMLSTWCGNDGSGGVWGQTVARYRRIGF